MKNVVPSSNILLASQIGKSWSLVLPEPKPTGSDFSAEYDYSCKRYSLYMCVCLLVYLCAQRCAFMPGECLGNMSSLLLLCFNSKIYNLSSLTCCISPCMYYCYCVFFQLLLIGPPFSPFSWLLLWIILSCVYLIVSVYPLYCFAISLFSFQLFPILVAICM